MKNEEEQLEHVNTTDQDIRLARHMLARTVIKGMENNSTLTPNDLCKLASVIEMIR